MIGSLQAMLDRDVTGSEIDQPARDEERRHLARAALLQQDRGVGDAGKAADAGADQRAGGAALFLGGGMPVGVVERLLGGTHRKDDEVVDLALSFGSIHWSGLKVPFEPSPRGIMQAIWQV